jgi:hypothetical protein
MVLEAGFEGWRHDFLLFHQLSTVHDDDFRHWWVLLPEPVLSRAGRGGGATSTLTSDDCAAMSVVSGYPVPLRYLGDGDAGYAAAT